MSSSQVCRPHFHAPLHPWLSDGSKSLAHSGPWVPFAGGDPDKSQSPSSAPTQPHNIFSFPPTPPKDSTPDSVAPSGGAEYQSAVAAAMGAFMHDNNPQSCAVDVKPQATNGKQREGSDYEGAASGMFNGNFESSYGSAYGHGIHGAAYSPQASAKQQLAGQGAQSPNKPRNKSRTSAGKNGGRCSYNPHVFASVRFTCFVLWFWVIILIFICFNFFIIDELLKNDRNHLFLNTFKIKNLVFLRLS